MLHSSSLQPTTNGDHSGGIPVSSRTLKLVGDAVLELNVARKSMLIYPASHEQVTHTLNRAAKALEVVLAEESPLVLKVQCERLFLRDHQLDPRSAVLKEFALVLRLLGITGIHFQHTPQKAQLAELVQFLTADPAKVREQGGAAAQFHSRDMTGIEIDVIDYSKIKTTQEQEIHRPGESEPTHAIWRNFVSHVAGSSGPEHTDAPIPIPDACTPSQMAGLLNSNLIDPGLALDYYQGLIGGLIQSDQHADAASDATRRGLSDFHCLILELTPALQRQFLSTAFDQMGRQGPTQAVEQLIDNMGGALIVRMLRQANNQGREISPSLLAFIGKMGWLADGTQAGETTAEVLESLMAREAYETYVDSGYDQMLRQIGCNRADDSSTGDYDRLRYAIEQSLEVSRVNTRICEALMQLMGMSQDAAEYRDFGRQLALLLNELICDGGFEILIRIFDFVTMEQQSQTEVEKKKVAGLVLNGFSDPKFIERVVALAGRLTSAEKARALEFVARMGDTAILEIFDHLRPDQTAQEADAWFALLEANASQAVHEALDRLRDPRPDYVRLMLRVIRRFGAGREAESLRPLLDHSDPGVRMDALAALLQSRNGWAVVRLRDMLNQPWSDETRRALDLAGKYRVSEVLPILTAWVDSKAPMSQDIDRREAALRTMGRIADPRSIETFSRLARRRPLFTGKYLPRLQQTLFDSLDEFSYEQIRELLRLGLRNPDAVVREACRRMMQLHEPQSESAVQSR